MWEPPGESLSSNTHEHTPTHAHIHTSDQPARANTFAVENGGEHSHTNPATHTHLTKSLPVRTRAESPRRPTSARKDQLRCLAPEGSICDALIALSHTHPHTHPKPTKYRRTPTHPPSPPTTPSPTPQNHGRFNRALYYMKNEKKMWTKQNKKSTHIIYYIIYICRYIFTILTGDLLW